MGDLNLDTNPMNKFEVEVVRVYTTNITIEAENKNTAYIMASNDKATIDLINEQEMLQCNSYTESIVVNQVEEPQ
jgi:hypothetical protein